MGGTRKGIKNFRLAHKHKFGKKQRFIAQVEGKMRNNLIYSPITKHTYLQLVT